MIKHTKDWSGRRDLNSGPLAPQTRDGSYHFGLTPIASSKGSVTLASPVTGFLRRSVSNLVVSQTPSEQARRAINEMGKLLGEKVN